MPRYAGRTLEMLGLAFKNILFTIVVPGAGAVLVPCWIMTRGGATPEPILWYAIPFIAVGAALYLACLWLFANIGRGTPGPWDAPHCLVVAGPYRWVRNPIYLAALIVVVGEAWLFLSLHLLVYAGVMALSFHLFVMVYEEPTLRRSFGDAYTEYLQTVPRWIPRKPRTG